MFDKSVRRALTDVRNRLDAGQLRLLEHDWGFLPPGFLTGTSGAMALLLAQKLAAPGLLLKPLGHAALACRQRGA